MPLPVMFPMLIGLFPPGALMVTLLTFCIVATRPGCPDQHRHAVVVVEVRLIGSPAGITGAGRVGSGEQLITGVVTEEAHRARPDRRSRGSGSRRCPVVRIVSAPVPATIVSFPPLPLIVSRPLPASITSYSRPRR